MLSWDVKIPISKLRGSVAAEIEPRAVFILIAMNMHLILVSGVSDTYYKAFCTNERCSRCSYAVYVLYLVDRLC